MSDVLHVYRLKGTESPFETFLRYTDEKEKSAAILAEIIRPLPVRTMLDIGAGTGDYTLRALTSARPALPLHIDFLEPSETMLHKLRQTVLALPPEVTYALIKDTFEHFQPGRQYDLILASHLFYHIPEHDRTHQLRRMLGLLADGGTLVIVLRGQDDVYQFSRHFKPAIKGGQAHLTLALPTMLPLIESVIAHGNYSTAEHTAPSQLHIPLLQNPTDALSIIEFNLDTAWNDVPAAQQNEILTWLHERGGVLQQHDSFLAITAR